VSEPTLVKDGKAYIRDREDHLYTVDSPEIASAKIAEGDRFPVTQAHLDEFEKKKKAEGLGAQIKTGLESAAASAIDAVQAPIAAPIRLGAAALGYEGDPLENIHGRATVENAATLFGDLKESLGLSKRTGESYGREYAENARGRAEANPGTSLAGNVGGALAAAALTGGAGLAGVAGLAGKGAATALGEGAAARAAGALTAGALEGAAYGQAQAGEEAYLQNIPLSAEKLIASMGWGAVLGGGVSLAAHGAGSLLRRGSRGATPIDSPRLAAVEGAEERAAVEAGTDAGEAAGRSAPLDAGDWSKVKPANDVAAEGAERAAVPPGEPVAAGEAAAPKPAPEPMPTPPGAEAGALPPGEPVTPPPPPIEGVTEAAAAKAKPGPAREWASDIAGKALGKENADLFEKVLAGDTRGALGVVSKVAKHYGSEIAGGAIGGLLGGPLGAIAGGLAGKVAEHKVAAVMATLTERLAASLDGKIDQGLGAFFRESTARAQAAATGIGKVAPVPLKRIATPSAVDAFQGKSPDLQDAYQKRVAQLTDATRELGAGARAATLTAMGGAADTLPRLTAAAAVTATKGAQYLESQLPSGTKAPTMFQPSRTYTPSDLQIREFAQKWSAVANPLSVIDDLRRGTVTHAQIDALKNVYPELYSEVRIKALDKVRQVDESGDRMPLNDRLTLDLFLDLGGAGEPTLAPGFIDRMASVQAAEAKRVAEGTPGHSGAGLEKIGKSRASSVQATLGQG